MTVRISRMTLMPPPGGRLVRDWKGKHVITIAELSNFYGTLPTGTFATVERCDGGKGLELKSAKCGCCGVSLSIRMVSHRDVRLATPEEVAKTTGSATTKGAKNGN